MINKQAFELGLKKGANIENTANIMLRSIRPLLSGGMGAGLGALITPSNRSKGALTGWGIGTGLGLMDESYGNWNAPIGGLVGASTGYLLGGTPQDALMGAGLGLASSLPDLNIYGSPDKNNNLANRALVGAALNPLLGAALGAYVNPEDRWQGARTGGLIGAGMGIPGAVYGLGEKFIGS